MSKGVKIVLIIMVAIILIYVIVSGISTLINHNNNASGDLSGDNLNSSGENLEIKFEVTSGDNEVNVIAKSSGDITTTKYIFEDDKLKEIKVIEELDTNEAAQYVYDSMKSDENISQSYSDININEKTITIYLKQEYVDAFAGITKEELYNNQIESLNKNN